MTLARTAGRPYARSGGRAYGAAPRQRKPTDFRTSKRWRKLRLVILARDRWTCHWCQGPADQVDHVVPVVSGGDKWDTDNLVAACGPCNRGRGWLPAVPIDSGAPVQRNVMVQRGTVFLRRGDGTTGTFPHPHTQDPTQPHNANPVLERTTSVVTRDYTKRGQTK